MMNHKMPPAQARALLESAAVAAEAVVVAQFHHEFDPLHTPHAIAYERALTALLAAHFGAMKLADILSLLR
jgi:hypothetical protein